MSKCLLATESDFLKLNGYTSNNHCLIFHKDGLDRWVVNIENMYNPYFVDIKSELENLEIIDCVNQNNENDE
jgi:hypothetical protein